MIHCSLMIFKKIDFLIWKESLILPFWWKHLALCTWSIKSWEPGLSHVSATAVILVKAPFLPLLLCGSLVIVSKSFTSNQCYKFSCYIWNHFSLRKGESLTNSHGLQACRNYGILIHAKYKQQNFKTLTVTLCLQLGQIPVQGKNPGF